VLSVGPSGLVYDPNMFRLCADLSRHGKISLSGQFGEGFVVCEDVREIQIWVVYVFVGLCWVGLLLVLGLLTLGFVREAGRSVDCESVWSALLSACTIVLTFAVCLERKMLNGAETTFISPKSSVKKWTDTPFELIRDLLRHV
jgi:hypothetical protein